MCWRIEGKTTVCGAALLGAALLLCAGIRPVSAQDLPLEIVRLIEAGAEDGGGDPEAIAEYFQNCSTGRWI